MSLFRSWSPCSKGFSVDILFGLEIPVIFREVPMAVAFFILVQMFKGILDVVIHTEIRYTIISFWWSTSFSPVPLVSNFGLAVGKMLLGESNISIWSELRDEVVSWWWLRSVLGPVPFVTNLSLSLAHMFLGGSNIRVRTKIGYKVVSRRVLWLSTCWSPAEFMAQGNLPGSNGFLSIDHILISPEVRDEIIGFVISLLTCWRPGEKWLSFSSYFHGTDRIDQCKPELGVHFIYYN